MKGNSKRPSRNSLSMLGAENKHLGAASQTSLTEVKLPLRRKILFTQNPVLQIFEFNWESLLGVYVFLWIKLKLSSAHPPTPGDLY